MPAEHPDNSPAQAPRIRVKLMMKCADGVETENLLRRFPGGKPSWGRCDFVLDYSSTDYDWLVVYDDLPSSHREKLACPRNHTLLVTAEPSSIKTYGSAFLGQFGHVLTSQEPWAIRHPNAVFSQPALLWFYGRNDRRGAYDTMASLPMIPKTKDLSTVCSAKRQTHTLHRTRYDFIQALRTHLPDLDVFGHGVRPIVDKADAVDGYRYHIAIENHIAEHHWTEKLADPLLGYSLPFYCGCPNAADYLPADSFIPINMEDAAGTAETIRLAIRDDEWARRLPAIREARRRLLDELGMFPTLARLVESRHGGSGVAGGVISSRRALRKSNPTAFFTEMYERIRNRSHNRLSSLRA
ncbi:glycosyltransferase [Akkermansiaceae bacterium]|nr:glycosyltransferase [Akkermansiaceae bacterium]